MLSIEELRRYDWCTFYDCQTNVKDKKSGAKVGKYLACSGYDAKWKIYQVYGGLPIANVWVNNLADSVKIATFIDKEYGEFLAIYETNPEWEVLGIARLSVPNGEKIWNALRKLEQLNRSINYNDFVTMLGN